MADYFSEYSAFVGAKGLPSPADTPYETPGFLRSKRSSRSREQSSSPPPLPPDGADYAERPRDGRYSALDPRRFTPTLHASLVSEILNLRRELDSKNTLVENLESRLDTTENENKVLNKQLSTSSKEARSAKQQVQQMERGTSDALESLAKERDAMRSTADDLRGKLDAAQTTTRRQDDDALRNQASWEREKELWDNERRQLERRIHVTEARLRTFVEEMSAQQALAEAQTAQQDETGDEGTFKDSGLGNDSDVASVSSKTDAQHTRNISSMSTRSRSMRHSNSTRATSGTPDLCSKPGGYSLADELGIDEEDEYEVDESEHADDELEYPERARRTMGSPQGFEAGDQDAKAKLVLGLTDELPQSPVKLPLSRLAAESMVQPTSEEAPQAQSKLKYVDTGYQPTPPPSPPRFTSSYAQTEKLRIIEPVHPVNDKAGETENSTRQKLAVGITTTVTASPISPPETPGIDGVTGLEKKRMSISARTYSEVSTQTDLIEPEPPTMLPAKRDSLQLPTLVPSIAIHPPSSRPSTPRPCVLPPGTKNASTQARLSWSCRDASVQTQEIRVDKRPSELAKHLLPTYLLPDPSPSECVLPRREANVGTATIFIKTPPAAPSIRPPAVQSPTDSSPELSRDNGNKDLRPMPLKAIPIPTPILTPLMAHGEPLEHIPQGLLNRTTQYSVTQQKGKSKHLVNTESDSDSDLDDPAGWKEPSDLAGSVPALSRPAGRFGLSEPPKVIPEDKEASPEQRPPTSGSYGAAPAPSIASSQTNSHRIRKAPPLKLNTYHGSRSRSPSFGSVASSTYSTQSALPPYPIPVRSSSRVVPQSHSEGSRSPTPGNSDVFGIRTNRSARIRYSKQPSLRKVQSAAAMRHNAPRASPSKHRRRRRSPDLTPVQSMAFDSPVLTKFRIPDVTSTHEPSRLNAHGGLGSRDLGRTTSTADSGLQASEEANLVDAIAATMVGEWMWKYVRKRKSFGVGDAADDVPQTGVDGSMNITGNGVRHKRWVWLSPYERTIMWDSKQPTSGSALLGKKGRKLAIESVLDVRDDTPMPKGVELKGAFNRSIMILTPARALKFTAPTAERHVLWMTALSFLAQSTDMPVQPQATFAMPTVPRIPDQSHSDHTKRSQSPSFGRAKIRDSVYLAQGRQSNMPQSYSHGEASLKSPAIAGQSDGADFPAIPRHYSSTNRHQRKRSNTSPRLPPPLNNLRSASSGAVPSSASSNLQPGSTSTFRLHPPRTSSKAGSRNGSISPAQANFFEAVGTVRMEAFVDPSVRDGVVYVPAPPRSAMPAAPWRRRGESNVSTSTSDKRRAGYVFDEHGFDPFKGF